MIFWDEFGCLVFVARNTYVHFFGSRMSSILCKNVKNVFSSFFGSLWIIKKNAYGCAIQHSFDLSLNNQNLIQNGKTLQIQ